MLNLKNRVSDCLLDLIEVRDISSLNDQSRSIIASISGDGIRYLVAIEAATSKKVDLPDDVVDSMYSWCDFVDEMICQIEPYVSE